jgi:DNA polymerase beta
VPVKSRGAALLAHTGDVEFNKHLRAKALGMGMELNEYGLWRWQADANRLESRDDEDDALQEDWGFWELVRAETEEEILSEVGMPYVEPEKRNFKFVVGRGARGRRPSKS